MTGGRGAGRRPPGVHCEAGARDVCEDAGRIEQPGEETRAALAGALDRPLILASASPRRAELLRQVGIAFEVRVSDAPEDADVPGAGPAEVAQAHAREKALAVAARVPGRLVLGADTVVVLDGRVLGKPESADEAREMLHALSGREHEVITGVAIALGAGTQARVLALEHVSTRVRFRDVSDEQIETYVASGEPMDKAGAYGIQGRGALLVDEIEGCYFNVVGLPLSRTWEIIERLTDGLD